MSSRPTLLLVEDDATTVFAMKAILKRWGWDVTAVTTVAEAIESLRQSTPLFVVLDLMLPDGRGTTVLRAIRESEWDIRVIVTTGAHDDLVLGEVAALRPDLFLNKPIDVNALHQGLGH